MEEDKQSSLNSGRKQTAQLIRMKVRSSPSLGNGKQKTCSYKVRLKKIVLKGNLEDCQQSPKGAHKQIKKAEESSKSLPNHSITFPSIINLGVNTVLSTRENKNNKLQVMCVLH